jgi:hypothetical protein
MMMMMMMMMMMTMMMMMMLMMMMVMMMVMMMIMMPQLGGRSRKYPPVRYALSEDAPSLPLVRPIAAVRVPGGERGSGVRCSAGPLVTKPDSSCTITWQGCLRIVVPRLKAMLALPSEPRHASWGIIMNSTRCGMQQVHF